MNRTLRNSDERPLFGYQLLTARLVGNLPFGDEEPFILIVVMGTGDRPFRT